MHLSDYMALHNLSDEEFAHAIQRTRETVNRIRRGAHRPDWKTIDRISKVTNDAVTAADFVDIKKPEKRRRRSSAA